MSPRPASEVAQQAMQDISAAERRRRTPKNLQAFAEQAVGEAALELHAAELKRRRAALGEANKRYEQAALDLKLLRNATDDLLLEVRHGATALERVNQNYEESLEKLNATQSTVDGLGAQRSQLTRDLEQLE